MVRVCTHVRVCTRVCSHARVCICMHVHVLHVVLGFGSRASNCSTSEPCPQLCILFCNRVSVAQADFELTLHPRQALNLKPSYFSFLSSGDDGLCRPPSVPSEKQRLCVASVSGSGPFPNSPGFHVRKLAAPWWAWQRRVKRRLLQELS